MELPCRRFGRTNLNMPVLSLGGMRFQKSWNELNFVDISRKEQNKVENILNLANKFGFNHIETAKYYGTCLLYTSPSPRDSDTSRMPSSA